jgi:hypothetical protein
MVMHNPPHPSEVIKELCIEPVGMAVTEAAKGLGLAAFMKGQCRYFLQSVKNPPPFFKNFS